MGNKKHLPGYHNADWELQGAIFKATIESRVLIQSLRDMRKAIRKANRWGTTINFECYLVDYLNHGMAENLQWITRQVNAARRASLEFLRLNCRDD